MLELGYSKDVVSLATGAVASCIPYTAGKRALLDTATFCRQGDRAPSRPPTPNGWSIRSNAIPALPRQIEANVARPPIDARLNDLIEAALCPRRHLRRSYIASSPSPVSAYTESRGYFPPDSRAPTANRLPNFQQVMMLQEMAKAMLEDQAERERRKSMACTWPCS